MSTIFDTFKARAEAVSAEVHRFPTKPEALDFILQFLQKENIADAPEAYAAWADCPFLSSFDKAQLAGRVPGLKFEVTRQIAADARVGISELDWGIANTGTLVQDAAAVEKRLVSTLPIIHIALVGANAIVPDLGALLARIGPRQASYLAFITGPSRTADIERVLTIGVHGPERLVIVCVDELGGAN
jgi:L-lactate dehydrogenase complex protein LldG